MCVREEFRYRFSCLCTKYMMLSVRHLTLKLRSQSLNEESNNLNNSDKVKILILVQSKIEIKLTFNKVDFVPALCV